MVDALTSPTAAFFRRSQAQMDALRQEAETLQLQVSTGTRLERSSDDPVASARLRALGRADRLATVDAENAARAIDELGSAGTQLEDIAAVLIRARELAIQGANSATSPDARLAIAEELAMLHDSVFSSINATSSSGRPLFGGDASGPAYVRDAANIPVYAGSATPATLPIAEGLEVETGLTGPAVLNFSVNGTNSDTFTLLRTLAEAMRGAVADPAQAARDALPGLDAALGSVTRSEAVLGARAAWVETVDTAQTLRAEARATEGGELGGTDLARAISRLQQVLTALEASQASFTRIASLSLFSKI